MGLFIAVTAFVATFAAIFLVNGLGIADKHFYMRLAIILGLALQVLAIVVSLFFSGARIEIPGLVASAASMAVIALFIIYARVERPGGAPGTQTGPGASTSERDQGSDG